MKIIQFEPGRLPEPSASDGMVSGKNRFFWLDVERTENAWYEKVQNSLGIRFDERHLRDTLNDTHPPYFDATDDYDLLIVRAICPESLPEFPSTCPVAFIITNNAIVSIRPPGDLLFDKIHSRLHNKIRTSPTTLAMLLYQLLNRVIDGLLAYRDETTELLTLWQERLLKQNGQFVDWHALIRLHGQLRRIEVTIDSQMDALTDWREQATLILDGSLEIRFNDLQEHLRRVYNHAVVVQHDIDAMVQIYFSATTQRTNDILQFLTVISATFLPLNLVAGLFGMNFSHLPFLNLWYGPLLISALMITIVIGMLVWFRHKRWF
jgi:magnesium/cobalt transport protein CorA